MIFEIIGFLIWWGLMIVAFFVLWAIAGVIIYPFVAVTLKDKTSAATRQFLIWLGGPVIWVTEWFSDK
jgi:hypothetical protein